MYGYWDWLDMSTLVEIVHVTVLYSCSTYWGLDIL